MSANDWQFEFSSGNSGYRNLKTGEWIYSDEYQLRQYVEDFGDYNSMPSPWQEISVNKYIHKRSSHKPIKFESRYVTNNNIGYVNIEFFNGFGLAVRLPNKWKLQNNEIVYVEDFRYYLIGCDHSFNELSYYECKERGIPHYGKCWHVHECVKCKKIESADSSD